MLDMSRIPSSPSCRVTLAAFTFWVAATAPVSVEGAQAPAERVRCGEYEAVAPAASAGKPVEARISRAGQTVKTIKSGVAASFACQDVTGDGITELLVESYTGGVRCCMVLQVFELTPRLRPLLRYESGALGFEVRDLDNDGRPELLLADDRFDGFDGLCHACAPNELPLVACFRAGRFDDCTREFPEFIRERIPGYADFLKTRTSWQRPYLQGAALGLYALYALLGEETKGWEAVRAIVADPEVTAWLERRRPAVRSWATNRLKELREQWSIPKD